MFQCLGLGTHENGGCGEDWWHPGCVVGLGPKWFEGTAVAGSTKTTVPVESHGDNTLPTVLEGSPCQAIATTAPTGPNSGDDGEGSEDSDNDDPAPPSGFPSYNDFEGFICYKCVEAFPWIKRYASAPGFLPPVFLPNHGGSDSIEPRTNLPPQDELSKKRKAGSEHGDSQEVKRQKADDCLLGVQASFSEDTRVGQSELDGRLSCKLDRLPPTPKGRFSLFFKEGFRDNLCRCPSCFPLLLSLPQLLDEEETYEPPVSEKGSENGGSTQGSGSLLDRGESALRNIDRVRAIEGVMAYNHLKDKLKPFFQQFAESGRAVGAEDIKEYFAKLRGDKEAIREAGEAAKSDFRQEQSGY